MIRENKSHELQGNSRSERPSVLREGPVAASRRGWRLVGVFGFFLAVALYITFHVGPGVSSAQRSTPAGTKSKGSPPISNKEKESDGDIRGRLSGGSVTITDVTKDEGAAMGQYDCTIEVNIDPLGGEVSAMPSPMVSWKDGTSLFGDFELQQAGTTTIWGWSGSLPGNPTEVEVRAYFIHTDSESRSVADFNKKADGSDRSNKLKIEEFIPPEGKAKETYDDLKIIGKNFGEDWGDNCKVTIATFNAPIVSWSDTEIVVKTSKKMTEEAGMKQVIVHNEDHKQDKKDWIVTKSE